MAMSPKQPSAPYSAQLLVLENQGGGANSSASRRFRFGDFMRKDNSGRGTINVPAAEETDANAPPIRDRFCCGCCRSCLEEDAGKSAIRKKPTLVFFFDEAHLLFKQCAEGAARKDSSKSCA
jgi:hypothetical protein